HVGLDRAREPPDLGRETRLANQLDRAPVVGGDAREAGLDPLDTECVEPSCELELIVGAEHDADRLLAVAQRRVVEADLGVEPIRVVDAAGPELGRHVVTIPSGNDESFSAPSRVIRKLSSTRSPPPPSQYTPGSIASTMPSSIVPPPA